MHVPDGLVCVLSLCMLACQLLLEGCMLGSALPNTALKGSTALVVPLQLRIHFLQKKQKQNVTSFSR